MDMPEPQFLSGDFDKRKIPPIDQKRMLAFVNRFIVMTCSYLNDFAINCENKLISLERSLQKVEASLIILEAKLSSIPGLEVKNVKVEEKVEVQVKSEPEPEPTSQVQMEVETSQPNETMQTIEHEQESGIKACDDYRYRKYFKMLQFGVPPQAVKLKMSAEGFDSDILDTPNKILPDGRTQEEMNED